MLGRELGRRRVGCDADVAWIKDGTERGMTITAAIPAVFERYATVVVHPQIDEERSDAELFQALCAATSAQPWWLGYLETGGSDVVFPDAARISLYANWCYVLVEAAPE